MTQDPFEALSGALGGGGLDMNALLQQAQEMQAQLEAAQQRLNNQTVQGTVAGGAVTVTVSGVGELVGVEITPGQFDTSDAEGCSDLADMLVAAYRDGKGKAESLANEAMGPLGGGLPDLPGLG